MNRIAAVLSTLLLLAAAAECMVTVSPEMQIIKCRAGGRAACAVTVTNAGSEPADVDVQPEDWTRTPGSAGCGTWLKASPSKFRLAPGKSRKVKLKAALGTEEPPYRLTQIFFSSIEKKNAPLNIGTRVGSLVKWEISGKK